MATKKKVARPESQWKSGATCAVPVDVLRTMRSRLRDTQHAVVRAPNREIPLQGYGPIAALHAYDGIQGVIERLDALIGGAT